MPEDTSKLFLNSTAVEDQENSTSFLSTNLKSKIIDENLSMTEIGGTPRAKSVLSNRKVLAEKTPNNIKRPLQSIINNTSPTKSPSLLNNSLNRTPLAHPSLRDIAATTKTLSNPPDLFLQPLQKRRSVRHQKTSDSVTISQTNTSKLAVVFPTTSDELDLEEIEHAAGPLNENDDDSNDFLFGTSKIIPNLELHKNLDFSALLLDRIESKEAEELVEELTEEEIDSKLIIEPIVVEFKLDSEEDEEVVIEK